MKLVVKKILLLYILLSLFTPVKNLTAQVISTSRIENFGTLGNGSIYVMSDSQSMSCGHILPVIDSGLTGIEPQVYTDILGPSNTIMLEIISKGGTTYSPHLLYTDSVSSFESISASSNRYYLTCDSQTAYDTDSDGHIDKVIVVYLVEDPATITNPSVSNYWLKITETITPVSGLDMFKIVWKIEHLETVPDTFEFNFIHGVDTMTAGLDYGFGYVCTMTDIIGGTGGFQYFQGLIAINPAPSDIDTVNNPPSCPSPPTSCTDRWIQQVHNWSENWCTLMNFQYKQGIQSYLDTGTKCNTKSTGGSSNQYYYDNGIAQVYREIKLGPSTSPNKGPIYLYEYWTFTDPISISSYGSPVSLIALNASNEDILFLNEFNQKSWAGKLKAYDTVNKTTVWQTQECLSQSCPNVSGRNIWTYVTGKGKINFVSSNANNLLSAMGLSDVTTASNVINYVRGDHSLELSDNQSLTIAPNTTKFRKRTDLAGSSWVLGDSAHGNMIYWGAPDQKFDNISGYTAFKQAQSSRQGVIYLPANDGMIHAFNADTGKEIWAFIPEDVLPALARFYANIAYEKLRLSLTDAPLTVTAAKIGGTWKTLLLFGTKYGSKYYALDVTDPLNPKYLWSWTDSRAGLADRQPAIARVKVGGSPKWVMIVGSGGEKNTAKLLLRRPYIFAVDLATGNTLDAEPISAGGSTYTYPGCDSYPCNCAGDVPSATCNDPGEYVCSALCVSPGMVIKDQLSNYSDDYELYSCGSATTPGKGRDFVAKVVLGNNRSCTEKVHLKFTPHGDWYGSITIYKGGMTGQCVYQQVGTTNGEIIQTTLNITDTPDIYYIIVDEEGGSQTTYQARKFTLQLIRDLSGCSSYNEMQGAILTSAVPVDMVNSSMKRDDYVDYIYFGDSTGRLWRIDVGSTTSTLLDTKKLIFKTGGYAEITQQSGYTISQAYSYRRFFRPITMKPVVSYIRDPDPNKSGVYPIILFGTGRYLNFSDNYDPYIYMNVSNFNQKCPGGTISGSLGKCPQMVAGIIDEDGTTVSFTKLESRGELKTVTLGSETYRYLSNENPNQKTVAANKRGWYWTFPVASTNVPFGPSADPGERVVVDGQIMFKRFYFSTYKPKAVSNGSFCDAQGDSYLMIVRYETGAGIKGKDVFDVSGGSGYISSVGKMAVGVKVGSNQMAASSPAVTSTGKAFVNVGGTAVQKKVLSASGTSSLYKTLYWESR